MDHGEALEVIRQKFGGSVAAYLDEDGEYTRIGVTVGWNTITVEEIRQVQLETGWSFAEIEGSYEGSTEIIFQEENV